MPDPYPTENRFAIRQVRSLDGSAVNGDYQTPVHSEDGHPYTHRQLSHAMIYREREHAERECAVANDRSYAIHGSTPGTEAGIWAVVAVHALPEQIDYAVSRYYVTTRDGAIWDAREQRHITAFEAAQRLNVATEPTVAAINTVIRRARAYCRDANDVGKRTQLMHAVRALDAQSNPANEPEVEGSR